MVTFKLIDTTDRYFTWYYFPNGMADAGHGTIVIDRLEGRLELTELAPLDQFIHISVEEQLERRKAAAEMRKIEQMPELTEEEWPIPTGEMTATLFADFAIREILMGYNSGKLIEEGSSNCY
ncbi:MAG: hypothetical protein MJ135_02305 [Oscillospiraceae bacterium]|nr:hypothetical protein [Oscillospiraceae bacterium]